MPVTPEAVPLREAWSVRPIAIALGVPGTLDHL
jgi:hypothetical protein